MYLGFILPDYSALRNKKTTVTRTAVFRDEQLPSNRMNRNGGGTTAYLVM